MLLNQIETSRSKPCFFVQIEKKVADKWQKYSSYKELDSLYNEEHENDANFFYHTNPIHPYDFEDGLYRVVLYRALKVFYEGEANYDLEDAEIDKKKEFLIKTEKRIEWA